MKRLQKRVFVGMSGGVDSSVAALLSAYGRSPEGRQKYDVTGCFIKGWYPPGIDCSWRDDRRDAIRVCAKLGIPFITVDLSKEYKKSVVDYMVREYKAGRTPNPDIMCNRDIKFGAFLKWARARGADYIATGHYVRLGRKFLISKSEFLNNSKLKNSLKTKNFELKIAIDLNKDQSYFLWTLGQKELKYCLFPLGDLTKPEVRAIAKTHGIHTSEKPDSQGVCFIGEFKMEDFLKRYIKPKRGKVVTVEGNVIGEHDGTEFYTIGQRKGFGAGGTGVPQYVIAKDAKKNVLVVGNKVEEEGRYVKEVAIKNTSWVSEAPENGKLYKARVRYRQPLQSCRIRKIHNTEYIIQFARAQRAITPGQSLVVYSGKTMVGGGVIV